jgi:hypothetical protein
MGTGTVGTVGTVDTVNTVDTVGTVGKVDTVDTVGTVGTDISFGSSRISCSWPTTSVQNAIFLRLVFRQGVPIVEDEDGDGISSFLK